MTTAAPSPTGDVLREEDFRRFQQGDPATMERLVRQYHARLIGYARLYARDRDLAEEAAQEVFIALWQQRTQVRSAEGIRPWLFVAMRRWLLRRNAANGRRMEVTMDDESASVPEPMVAAIQSQGIVREQARRLLATALNELPEQERELVVLRYFGGLAIKEVAETLAMPMGSVGVKLGRTLEKLRAILEKKGLTVEDLIP